MGVGEREMERGRRGRKGRRGREGKRGRRRREGKYDECYLLIIPS